MLSRVFGSSFEKQNPSQYLGPSRVYAGVISSCQGAIAWCFVRALCLGEVGWGMSESESQLPH